VVRISQCAEPPGPEECVSTSNALGSDAIAPNTDGQTDSLPGRIRGAVLARIDRGTKKKIRPLPAASTISANFN
jgi:hypothetical protein